MKDVGIVPTFDSWSLLRLVQKYDESVNQSDSSKKLIQDLKRISSVVMVVRKLDLENEKRFPKGFVHGDLHSDNILKDNDGNMMLLDLGVINYSPRIVDLAIFLSNTCIDFDNPKKTRILFNTAISTYDKENPLTDAEKQALLTLIRANYAMFLLRSSDLLEQEPNNVEYVYWNQFAQKGLNFMTNFTF